MTATEWWLLAAAIAAGVGAFLHLLPPTTGSPRPWQVEAVARALVAVAVGLVAVALAVSPL